MNWTEIKNKYPTALIELLSWHFSTDENGLPFDLPIRNLYDFFDQQGIMVYIYPGQNVKTDFAIYIDNNGELQRHEKESQSRLDAESEAFRKAFALLEKKK